MNVLNFARNSEIVLKDPKAIECLKSQLKKILIMLTHGYG